jgi:hypothetical protein
MLRLALIACLMAFVNDPDAGDAAICAALAP